MEARMRVIESAEVSEHRSADSIWFSCDGLVYDATAFAPRHPGGLQMLVDASGGDVTRIMTSGPHKHSTNARKIMSKYVIGRLGHAAHDKIGNGISNGLNGKTNGFIEHENNNSKIDDLVDLDKPMIWQVGKLGVNYEKWTHTFHDKDLQFFRLGFLEWFTKCQWYVVPIFWTPIIILFLYLSYNNFSQRSEEGWLNFEYSCWSMPFLFVFGFLLWTFFEYIIHRFIFHLIPSPNSPLLTTIHFLFHGQHHKNPMNKDRLVFPPVPAAPFAFIIYHICHLLFPVATAQCVVAGIATGYVFYDMVHYYLHHGQPTSAYWKDLKHYHMRHHYFNSDYGFGISSKLWDYPFGTLFPKDVKQKYS